MIPDIQCMQLDSPIKSYNLLDIVRLSDDYPIDFHNRGGYENNIGIVVGFSCLALTADQFMNACMGTKCRIYVYDDLLHIPKVKAHYITDVYQDKQFFPTIFVRVFWLFFNSGTYTEQRLVDLDSSRGVYNTATWVAGNYSLEASYTLNKLDDDEVAMLSLGELSSSFKILSRHNEKITSLLKENYNSFLSHYGTGQYAYV